MPERDKNIIDSFIKTLLLSQAYQQFRKEPIKEPTKKVHCILEEKSVDIEKCEKCPTQCVIYKSFIEKELKK